MSHISHLPARGMGTSVQKQILKRHEHSLMPENVLDLFFWEASEQADMEKFSNIPYYPLITMPGNELSMRSSPRIS